MSFAQRYQRTVPNNSNSMPSETHYRGHHQQTSQQGNHQHNAWGKRRYDNTGQTMHRIPGETSPAAKRQLQKQIISEHRYQRPVQNHNPVHKNEVQEAQKVPIQEPQLQNKPAQRNNIRSNPAKMAQEVKANAWAEAFSQTLKLIEICKPGEEVNILLTHLQPSRVSWRKTKEIINKDMWKLMTPLGIDRVYVFGSSLTDLDFHGSDLDYHVQLKNPPADSEIKEILQNVNKLTRYVHGQDFRVLFTVDTARVPITRLLHLRTRVVCDVNFTSKFGYYNSHFIGKCMGYDKRIKELAILVKLWSKAYKIAERMIMSSYCLIMLLIFYLQNLEDPMLDTILNNQRNRSPLILDSKFTWNFFFNDNIKIMHNNRQTTRQLLEGFFEFFHKLNYSQYIVSLFTGELINRNEFAMHPDLSYYREVVEKNQLLPLKADIPQAFIVQDGFEQNINIGIKVKKHCDEFFDIVKFSHEKCQSLKEKPFSELIVHLFTDMKLPSKPETVETKNKKKFQMTVHACAGDLKQCQDILTKKDDTNTKIFTAESQQKFFFEHIVESTKKFLQEIYLATVISEPVDALKNTMRYECKIFLVEDTINGRKKMNFNTVEALAAESALSKKMMEKKINLDLEMILTISSLDKGKTVDFQMHDIYPRKKTALLAFGNYFAVNIPAAIRFYLKQKWEDIKNK